MKGRDFIVIPVAAIAVIVLNVAISFAVIWLYSSFFNPGQSASHYEGFAIRVAPISSVIAGIPLMFVAGFLIAKGRPRRRGLLVAAATVLLYVLADIGVLLSADAKGGIWMWAALSHVTKLLSALAGAELGMIRSTRAEARIPA